MTSPKYTFFPREHGATAMLLTPFVASAVLARRVRWQEAAALIAIVVLFMVKDPLIVLARQQWVWTQKHSETAAAMHWAFIETALVFLCGAVLMISGPPIEYLVLFLGAAGFSALTTVVHIRNRQRATLFQVVSALALTATSLVAALAATSGIPRWCWLLWVLLAAQATAGIFTVHARLEARVAARKGSPPASSDRSRPIAFLCCGVLVLGSAWAFASRSYWIGGALLLAAGAYTADLLLQRNARWLATPLTRVGIRALTLSLTYAAMVIAGLW